MGLVFTWFVVRVQNVRRIANRQSQTKGTSEVLRSVINEIKKKDR
jgi:hypothetical protein